VDLRAGLDDLEKSIYTVLCIIIHIIKRSLLYITNSTFNLFP
jgi:hypothetical protein